MNTPHYTSRNGSVPLRGVWLVLILFCSSGATCNRAFRNPFAQVGPPAPEVLVGASSLDQVLAAVNQNASRIASYQTNNASITVPGVPGIPLLRGNIAAQQPGKVRLQASTALTGPEVDLGANDELFWFWVKRNEPPALYFSRHDQFMDSAAQQVLPIEPQWLLDALGMMQFAPHDRHEGPFPRGNDALEIRSIIKTRAGQMSKITVVDARRAWVLEQHIYNATGTLVASTRATDFRYHPEVGVSLPQDLELRVPSTQLSLSIDVGNVSINTLADNPALWKLPVLSGYPQIDLGSAAPGSIAPMGAAGSRDLGTLASPTVFGIAPTEVGTPASGLLAKLPSKTVQRPPVAVAVAPSEPASPLTYRLQPGGIALPSEVR